MSCETAKLNGGYCWCPKCWVPSPEFTEFWLNELERKIREKYPVAKITPKVYWITINPKPDTKLDVFLKLLEKSINKKWIDKYYYNIEQRGETLENIGTGLHSHMLIVPSSHKRKSEVHREFHSTFKAIVGNKLHVHIQDFPDNIIQDKLDYLNGLKWDGEKQTKINMDINFRLNNKLNIIYTNAEIQ
ncbi:MAG: putative replication initiation protein [Cressdnaviricota sp.]|nr:MAG: putative replication initiation protein [Cressdnaviricota sp.]